MHRSILNAKYPINKTKNAYIVIKSRLQYFPPIECIARTKAKQTETKNNNINGWFNENSNTHPFQRN